MKKGSDQAIEDINAKGGIQGQKIMTSYGDDVSDPKQGVSVANNFAADGVKFVDGTLQLRRHHSGFRSLSGKRHARHHAGRDQSEAHRSQYVERVPHMRPR